MLLKYISFLLSLFLLTAYSSLTPSSNFTVANFVRSWNLVGYYSTTDPESVRYYSCGTFNVTQGSLGVLNLNMRWLDATTSKFVDNTLEVLPNPLNPAMLISTTAPIAENNFAVVYDNNATETLILVNYAQDLAFVLSQFEFFYYDTENVEYFLNQSGIPFNSTTAITNTNCIPAPLIPLPNFDASILKGKFHGHGLFNGFNNTSCYDTYFTYNATMMNFTQVSTVEQYEVDYFTDLIVDPDMPSILIAAFCPYDYPFVVIYQHAESNTIVIMAEKIGYILSTQILLSDKVFSEAQQAIVAQGYTINSTNFQKMDLKCFLEEDNNTVIV